MKHPVGSNQEASLRKAATYEHLRTIVDSKISSCRRLPRKVITIEASCKKAHGGVRRGALRCQVCGPSPRSL